MVPGLRYEVTRIASSVYFQILHEGSGRPLFRHAIKVQGGGGVTRMSRVADAIFSRKHSRIDWTKPADAIDPRRGSAIVEEFESWLVDGPYGTQHVRDGAPEIIR